MARSKASQNPDGNYEPNLVRAYYGDWGTPSGTFTHTFQDSKRNSLTVTSGAPVAGTADDQFIARKIVEDGFNSNYVASWWLVRSGMNLTKDGAPAPFGGNTANCVASANGSGITLGFNPTQNNNKSRHSTRVRSTST